MIELRGGIRTRRDTGPGQVSGTALSGSGAEAHNKAELAVPSVADN